MALINCPECSTEISEYAETCNKCSFPIRKPVETNSTVNKTVQYNESHKGNTGTAILAILIFLILLSAGYYFYYTNTDEYKKKQAQEGIH